MIFHMTSVHHELLPESYLLLLLTPKASRIYGQSLKQGLRVASRSGKAAVWVDCELVHALSNEAVRVLWKYHRRLQALHIKLVLVHASEEVQRGLLDWELGPTMCFAPTLFDAAWHTRQRVAA